MEMKDLAGFSEPTKELISRCFDVLGMKQRPAQIIREAQAEAEAAVIKARSNVEVQKIEVTGEVEVSAERHRAISRILHQGEKEQRNIESIIGKALPEVKEGAKPQAIEEDWLNNFFDKCRLTSDDEMQFLWAKILAGESEAIGSYSKRTVNLLESLSKKEAEKFQLLCRFSLTLDELIPIIYEIQDEIYKNSGLTFDDLQNLQSLGLITFAPVGQFTMRQQVSQFKVHYFSHSVALDISNDDNMDLMGGCVFLTAIGHELVKVCNLTPVDEFPEYLKKNWAKLGYTIISHTNIRF